MAVSNLQKISDAARDALLMNLETPDVALLKCSYNSQRNNRPIKTPGRTIFGSSQCSVTSIGIWMSGFAGAADSDAYVYRIGNILGLGMFSSRNFVGLMQNELNRFGVKGRVKQFNAASRDEIKRWIASGSPLLCSTRSIDPPYKTWRRGYRPIGHFWPIIGYTEKGVTAMDPYGDGTRRYRGGRSGKFIFYTWEQYDGWTLHTDIRARKLIGVVAPEPRVPFYSADEARTLIARNNPGVAFE